MDILTLVIAITAVVAGAAIGWTVAQRRSAARIEEARGQAERADRAQQVVSQNAQQMRRQIDQLQRDLASLMARAAPTARGRTGASDDAAARARPTPTADATAREERTRAAEAALAAVSGGESSGPITRPSGFADTLPMDVPDTEPMGLPPRR